MYIQIQNSYFKLQYSEMQTGKREKGEKGEIGGMLHMQFLLKIFALHAFL